jgi:carbonic anhydrase
MHLVHQSDTGKLAVLAFFVEINNEKIDRYGLFQGIENEKHISTIKLEKILKNAGAHFYYEGSLTTPPCTEGVHWIVFDKHIKLHKSQVENFTAIYHRNYRPVQKKYDRPVFHSSI